MEGHSDRSGGSGGPPSSTDESNELRYRTLRQLEALLRLLVERHGSRTTLGEELAVIAAMARFCHQDEVSIAEIAEATGLPKQSLSRWAKKRVGESIDIEVNEDDQRMLSIRLLDDHRAQEHIEALAELLGTHRAG